MEQFIGCDSHKKFSVFVARKDRPAEALRVAHDRQLYREFPARLPAHSAILVEASGSYSWLADEMERSGHRGRPNIRMIIASIQRSGRLRLRNAKSFASVPIR
jgi:hypothetical protein